MLLKLEPHMRDLLTILIELFVVLGIAYHTTITIIGFEHYVV